ncbi:MAG: tail fiber domain-containing protein [Candidatus Omnitrophica bacterium]|nr:tail fiber domain-containing protein [Candidatus Omnitrophota bacterium]
MRAKRIAIGDTYFDGAEVPWEEEDGDGGTIDYLADLIVEGNVGIGTTGPNTALDLNGALSVRGMTAPDVSPAGQGRIYFDSTANKFKMSENTGAYTDLGCGLWAASGSNIYNTNNSNVGIGTTNPGHNRLDVYEDSGYPAAHFYSTAGHTSVNIDSKSGSHTYLNLLDQGVVKWRFTCYDSTDILYIFDQTNSNGVYMNQGATSWSSSSDIRLKTNISSITNALERIGRIRGVNFNWAKPGSSPKLQIGVIGQEVQAVFPEIVTLDDYGYLGVQYDRLAPILIEAIKEQQNQVDVLRTQNKQLEARINKLEIEIIKGSKKTE